MGDLAQKPLKAPASHEPVIPAYSMVVIGVIGLKAISKPLTDDWVFRSELFAKRTGLSLGDPVTVDAGLIWAGCYRRTKPVQRPDFESAGANH